MAAATLRLERASPIRYSAVVVDEDFEVLRGHGFDDATLWDIGAITALLALSKRMANLTAMRRNDEFYNVGRQL